MSDEIFSEDELIENMVECALEAVSSLGGPVTDRERLLVSAIVSSIVGHLEAIETVIPEDYNAKKN